MYYLIMVLMILVALFLIMLVLVQRGRGGGLAGALGGMGGQSAFGTKAGDTFTWVTYGAAAFWIILCVASIKLFDTEDDPTASGDFGTNAPINGTADGAGAGAGTSKPASERGASGAGKEGKRKPAGASKPAGSGTPAND